ncbi:MAG TPA: DUF308 domain-containing protein [Candidatus Dormibacteraeota bacterium]|nr:DUF308 domain-containing protein [Candidatus Dormibacteraeota bacterium]
MVSFAESSATPWWLVLLEGIAALLIGLLLLTNTGATLFTLVVFLGVYWLVTGVLDLVMLFIDRSQWGWKLFSGIIGIVAGLVIVRDPLWASLLLPATLVWLLGGIGIVIGAIAIVRAFMGGGLASAILGVISILLGGILLFNTAVSTVVLVYAVAIWAVIGGIFAIVGSLLLRGRQHAAADRTAQQPLAQA